MLYKRRCAGIIGTARPAAQNPAQCADRPYLWALWLVSAIPALLFWRFPALLMLSCLGFAIVYVWLYMRLLRWRTPWLILRRR